MTNKSKPSLVHTQPAETQERDTRESPDPLIKDSRSLLGAVNDSRAGRWDSHTLLEIIPFSFGIAKRDEGGGFPEEEQ